MFLSWYRGLAQVVALAQELAGLASVITLGGASSRPDETIHRALLPAPRWFLGMDADDAGDKAAAGWPARSRRVRPPGSKDWSEAVADGKKSSTNLHILMNWQKQGADWKLLSRASTKL